MDGRERFLLVPLNIGEEDDVDISVGVATKHRAPVGVDAFLLREHDVPGAINSEPQPMPYTWSQSSTLWWTTWE